MCLPLISDKTSCTHLPFRLSKSIKRHSWRWPLFPWSNIWKSYIAQVLFQSGSVQGFDFFFLIRLRFSMLAWKSIQIEIDSLLDIQSNSKPTHAGPHLAKLTVQCGKQACISGLTRGYPRHYSLQMLRPRVRAPVCARIHPKPGNVSWVFSKVQQWQFCESLRYPNWLKSSRFEQNAKGVAHATLLTQIS